MQSLQQNETFNKEATLQTVANQNSLGKPSLSPFLTKTLEGSDFCNAFYCQKHNMIIACFLNSTIEFYDATALLPLERRKTQQLDGYVTCLSYYDKTDTFLLGCDSGSIYAYHADNHELKLLRNCEEKIRIRRVSFVNSKYYVFGHLLLRGFTIGSLDNEDFYKVNSQNSDCSDLVNIPKRNLLLASYKNGLVRTYYTKKLPNLKVLCSVKAHQAGESIENININGKEYAVTAGGNDLTVKIWHFVKGKMRLLRIIHTEERVFQFVYLENYKMIAAPRASFREIRFWNILSGKLEKTFFYHEKREIWDLFLMKDKNIIGGVSGIGIDDYCCDSIEFIQLHQAGGKF